MDEGDIEFWEQEAGLGSITSRVLEYAVRGYSRIYSHKSAIHWDYRSLTLKDEQTKVLKRFNLIESNRTSI